jgi:type IV conjugative transfer system coupling protein TraD
MREEPNFKHYTRGGQISFHNVRMWDQITKNVLMICISIGLLITVLLTLRFATLERILHAITYYCALIFHALRHTHTFSVTFHHHAYHQNVEAILYHAYYQKNVDTVLHCLIKASEIAGVCACFMAIGLSFYFINRGKQQTSSQYVRGTRMADPKQVKQRLLKAGLDSPITIDGFPLVKDSEVQHLLIHGTVGTGKSQLMMKIMDGLRSRGDRVIIYDKGCAFIPHYYRDKTDVILNPFDTRCVSWDLWLEAPRDSDLENMAESLIPMHGESDPFWVNAARTVFASAASQMRADSTRSLDKLLRLLLTSEFTQLEAYLAGTPGATLVSNKIEKTAISIRSVITTYLKSLQSQALVTEGGPFSIRDYILNQDNPGWLFISSNGEQHKSLKPLMSMWLSMASLTLLSLTPNSSRRIWFICDELPSLHKLPLLGETIAEVRKFGGCFLLGMQSFAQLEKVYGRSGAEEIFDVLNTRFFFRSPSADMARLVSRELGEEDMDESREQYSYGANSVRDGISLGTQRIARPIVSYPEILELPNLTCYVRLPGAYPVTKLTLKHQHRAVIADALSVRNIPITTNQQSETERNEAIVPKEETQILQEGNNELGLQYVE